MAETETYQAVGRRKTSTASVYAKSGKGNITVNKKPLEEYFGRETSRMIVNQPLEIADVLGQYDLNINVKGGGASGQAGAIRHAIGRVLIKIDAAFRAVLKPEGILTRDARKVERKKPGFRKARKKEQYSKR